MALPPISQKLFHPTSLDSKTTPNKAGYVVASFAIGILTLGIGHAIYGLSRLVGKVNKDQKSKIHSETSKGNVNLKFDTRMENMEDFKKIHKNPDAFNQLSLDAKKRYQPEYVEYLVISEALHDETEPSKMKEMLPALSELLMEKLNITEKAFKGGYDAKNVILGIAQKDTLSQQDVAALKDALNAVDEVALVTITQILI